MKRMKRSGRSASQCGRYVTILSLMTGAVVTVGALAALLSRYSIGIVRGTLLSTERIRGPGWALLRGVAPVPYSRLTIERKHRLPFNVLPIDVIVGK